MQGWWGSSECYRSAARLAEDRNYRIRSLRRKAMDSKGQDRGVCFKVNSLTKDRDWSSTIRQLSGLLVFPWMVGTAKLPGRAGGGVPRDSLWPRSLLCVASDDDWDGGAAAIVSDRVRQGSPYRMYYLHLSWSVMDSIATMTEDESVFEPLPVGDESFKIAWHILWESKSRFYQGGSSPHESFCISMLDLWRRFTIMSGSRLSGDCNHGDNIAAIKKCTHCVMAKSVNLQQVIIVNDYHIAIRCLLHIRR